MSWLRKLFPSFACLGLIVKPLWQKMCCTGADVAETEKTFPAMAAISDLQFQPSAATMDQLLATGDDTSPPHQFHVFSSALCVVTPAELVEVFDLAKNA